MTWGDLAGEVPALASFGQERLAAAPAYLATVDAAGLPRVHPVTPILGGGHLFVFMEPTSPKSADLRANGGYALHCGVPDSHGTGGEFWVRGRALPVDDGPTRAAAADASPYVPADRYVLFELDVLEARCNGYGDVALPEPRHWRASGS